MTAKGFGKCAGCDEVALLELDPEARDRGFCKSCAVYVGMQMDRLPPGLVESGFDIFANIRGLNLAIERMKKKVGAKP